MAAWSFDDRTGWRYSYGGRPVEQTSRFLRLLTGEDRVDIHLLSIVTDASLDTWQRFFDGSEWSADSYKKKNLGLMPLVRHPAPDMAYVFCPLIHPDQTEQFTIDKETQASVEIATLLYDVKIRDWKVHTLGGPISPHDVEIEPF